MAAKELRVGGQAPVFALLDGSGATVALAGYRGQRVVLYFYPKDDTPGCTKEACSFRDERAALAREDAVVLGVSCDTGASHQRFTEKYHLTFPLLSDPDATVCKAYGVYAQKSMYGRTYWGIERSTFVIDERGRIAAIFRKVKVDGHTADILSVLRSLALSVSRR